MPLTANSCRGEVVITLAGQEYLYWLSGASAALFEQESGQGVFEFITSLAVDGITEIGALKFLPVSAFVWAGIRKSIDGTLDDFREKYSVSEIMSAFTSIGENMDTILNGGNPPKTENPTSAEPTATATK